MLDEIAATTGYARRYVMWLLNHPEGMQHIPRSQRQQTFGPDVQHALFLVWEAATDSLLLTYRGVYQRGE